jgi:hypothetical protein
MVGCAGNGENVGEEGRVLICVGVPGADEWEILFSPFDLPSPKW